MLGGVVSKKKRWNLNRPPVSMLFRFVLNWIHPSEDTCGQLILIVKFDFPDKYLCIFSSVIGVKKTCSVCVRVRTGTTARSVPFLNCFMCVSLSCASHILMRNTEEDCREHEDSWVPQQVLSPRSCTPPLGDLKLWKVWHYSHRSTVMKFEIYFLPDLGVRQLLM